MENKNDVSQNIYFAVYVQASNTGSTFLFFKQNKKCNFIYLPNYEWTSYVIFSNFNELVLSLTALNGSFYFIPD